MTCTVLKPIQADNETTERIVVILITYKSSRRQVKLVRETYILDSNMYSSILNLSCTFNLNSSM